MQIYESAGWERREATKSIVENNLYGLDIDCRAFQLAYFAIMMKARQYDRRFLTRGIEPHLYWPVGDTELGEFGSLLIVENWERKQEDQISLYDYAEEYRWLLTGQFHVVVTNPPYMASGNLGAKTSKYMQANFPESKADLFASFIDRCGRLTMNHGFQAMITQHAWMFLSSYERLRSKLQTTDIINLIHLGPRAFEEIGGEVVQTASFVIRKSHVKCYKGTYCRLIEPNTQQGKEEMFLARENRYVAQQDNFSKIPGAPVAYWVSDAFFKAFENKKIGEYVISDGQTKTGNNDKYLRLLWEVDSFKVGKGKKWVLHAKGGAFRRWFGNVDTLIDWSETARAHYRSDHIARIAPEYIWFRSGICWTLISSSSLHGFRLLENNSTFNLAAPSVFLKEESHLFYVLGYLNSRISEVIISLLNPTLNTNISDITSQPIIFPGDKIVEKATLLVKENISHSRTDWDSFETSWDFKRHPLV